MAKKKFKSKATAKRFRGIGRALEASRGEIEAQTRRDVQAMETARGQLAEQQASTIGALGDITRSENANYQRLTNLEQKARTTRYEAIVRHGESVVKKFETEAKQKQDYADYLRDLAPKRAKLVGELAQQGMQTVDTIRGVNQWTALKESGLLQQLTDGKADAHDSVVYDATGKVIESTNEGDADGANYRQDTSIRLSSHWAQKKFINWVKENKEALRNDVIENYNATAGEDKYGEWNAIRVQELGALGLLKKLGISDTTRNGTDIIEQFSAWGATDKQGFYETRKVGETQGRITDLTTAYKSTVAKKPDPTSKTYEADVEKYNKNVQVAFDNLMLGYKNGWFKAEYSGKVLNPNKGGGKYSNSADATFQALETIADNDRSIEPGNVNERLGNLRTPDLKGDGKTTTIRERFPERWEDFEKHVIDRHLELKKNEDRREQAEGVVFQSKFKPLVDKYNEDQLFSTPELVHLFREIENAKISDTEKAKAYSLLGYKPTDYTSSRNMRNIVSLLEAGDIDGALMAYNTIADSDKLTKQEKQFLLEKVTLFREVDQLVGLDNFTTKKKNLVRREENRGLMGRSMGDSGKLTANKLVADTIERYNDLRFTTDSNGKKVRSKVPLEQLWRQAETEVSTDWNNRSELKWSDDANGYIPVTPRDGAVGNPYNYIKALRGGEANIDIIYVNQADPDAYHGALVAGLDRPGVNETDLKTIRLEESRETKEGQKKIADARAAWFVKEGITTIPLKPEHYVTLVTYGEVSESAFLKDKRLMPVEDVKPIKEALEWNRDLNKLKEQGVDISATGMSYKEIPYSKSVLAISNETYLGEKYTKTQLQNIALYNLLGPGAPIIPFDDQDCAFVKTKGKTFKPSNKLGVSAYAACKAQNLTPVSKDVQNTIDSNGDAEQAFYRGMNIPEGFSQYDITKRYIQDGGLTLVPGFTIDKGIQLGLIPQRSIFDRLIYDTLPKRPK